MKLFRVALLSTFALLVLSACTSTSDLGAGKTGKSFVVKGYTYDQVWDAALKAAGNAKNTQSLEVSKNLNIQNQNKSAGTIQASTGLGLWSYGEVVGIFISPTHNAPSYTIEVESRAKLQTNVFSNNWEDDIINSIKQKLPTK